MAGSRAWETSTGSNDLAEAIVSGYLKDTEPWPRRKSRKQKHKDPN